MTGSRGVCRPDYGIDAPGVRRGMLIAAGAGLGLAVISGRWERLSGAAAWISGFGVLVAAYGLFMGLYMTYSSRIGKIRTRERLLDLAAAMRPWTGKETVLDVGCGRGLMLVGAARRLKTGKAVGIDLWRAEDQAGNAPEAALANASCEGVADRVQVDTGDARQLPYPDTSFDVVLSHWVIHNLPTAADRRRAIDEMLRVLRPGGVMVLADIAHISDYRTYLLAKGVTGLRTLLGGPEAAILAALSGGSYSPKALLALRP